MKANFSGIILKIIPIMFIILISGLGLPTAFAYTQTSVNDDLFATGTHNGPGGFITETSPIQQRLLQHSSGKVILITHSVINYPHIFVNVFSAGGTLLAHVDIYTAYNNPAIAGSSIAEIDSTYILIVIGVRATTAMVYAIKFNIIDYTFTSKNITFTTAGTAAIHRIGSPIQYNGNFYIFVYDYGTTSGTGYGIAKYNIAGDTLTKVGETVLSRTCSVSPPYGYLDSSAGKIYYIYSDPATWTMSIIVFDCATSTFTNLSTAPFTGGFPTINAFRYGYGNFITFYGSGIYHSGTYYYLYFAWSYSDRTGADYPGGSGVRFASTYFWYMKFNNSVSPGTMLLQNWITDSNLDSSSSVYAGCGVSWGFLYHGITTSTFDLCTYYQDIYAGKYISKVIYHINDIESDPTSFSTENIFQGVDNLDWKYIDYDAQMYNDAMHGISYHLIYDTESYLSVGGPIIGKIYTFSESYSPTDDPLLTNKNYVFTYIVYVNGIADNLNETAKIFVDGIERATKSIPISGSNVGKVIFNMMTGVAGTHSIMLKIYNNAGEFDAISDEYSYTFVTTGGVTEPPPAPELIGFYSTLFTFWLPVAIVVFMPMMLMTMAGAKYAGGAGAITGMIFGGAAGVIGGTVAGIIPTYALYLFVLLIAAAIVILFVRGSSGGGQGEP